MSFKTYDEGLRNAREIANKAVLTEGSLSSLSPLISPIPTLQKAFPLYITAAESYSHLLSSDQVPVPERIAIKKKWRLVLERAEKVKARVEELGGHIGKAVVGDEGEEGAIRRRGRLMNGIQLDEWTEPHEREWRLGKEGMYRDTRQPELADEQKALDAEWAELPISYWIVKEDKETRWMVKQGPGADCSVVAGLGVCMNHNRRWGTTLGLDALYPQASTGQPRHSENGKHITKLLLNGAWRSVVFDELLPRSSTDDRPLHATSQPIASSSSSTTLTEASIGPPWFPLALKGYFKAFGGYSIRGSNPAPDIYVFTGWIPETLSLKHGVQREKEWRRLTQGWAVGTVLVTLGTGDTPGKGLLARHAYGVLDVRVEGNKRFLEVFDPGSAEKAGHSWAPERIMGDLDLKPDGSTERKGIFTMTWDEIFTDLDAMYLNWKPEIMPSTATRHWSWPKPSSPINGSDTGSLNAKPRFRLKLESTSPLEEVWILLSQHITNKDRPLDDITLLVYEEDPTNLARGRSRIPLSPQRIEMSPPYSNAVNVLVRYSLRRSNINLIVMPDRDRGMYRTDFTIQAFAPPDAKVSLERIGLCLPFTQVLSGALTKRTAGGHAGRPSWMDNPQYRLTVSPNRLTSQPASLYFILTGDLSMAWNVMLLWGKGERASEVTQEMIVGDSGAYTYIMACLEIPVVQAGIYTVAVSAFEPGQTGAYTLSVESSHPVSLHAVPPEGAGMFVRTVKGSW